MRECAADCAVQIAAIVLLAVLQLAVAWPFASTFATGGVGVHRYAGPATPFVAWLQGYGLFLWVLLPWLLFSPVADGTGTPARTAPSLRLAGKGSSRLPSPVDPSGKTATRPPGCSRRSMCSSCCTDVVRP